jgi:hypothetical protein
MYKQSSIRSRSVKYVLFRVRMHDRLATPRIDQWENTWLGVCTIADLFVFPSNTDAAMAIHQDQATHAMRSIWCQRLIKQMTSLHLDCKSICISVLTLDQQVYACTDVRYVPSTHLQSKELLGAYKRKGSERDEFCFPARWNRHHWISKCAVGWQLAKVASWFHRHMSNLIGRWHIATRDNGDCPKSYKTNTIRFYAGKEYSWRGGHSSRNYSWVT